MSVIGMLTTIFSSIMMKRTHSGQFITIWELGNDDF